MVRIHDVEFLPPARIDPDNPPPWISSEYILEPAWLPLARRIVSDAGISGISDQQLVDVIATGKGSARDILDALISVVLDSQAHHSVC